MARKVLILGGPGDIHSAMVRWGLRELGQEDPTVWSFNEYPSSSTCSLAFRTGQNPSVAIQGRQVSASPFDTIWHRRAGAPIASGESHPADVRFIESESRSFVDNAVCFLGHASTLWINNPVAARAANNKAVQLLRADKIGFTIPATIMSNSPADIRDFYRLQDEELIYKPFRTAEWRVDGDNASRTLVLPTTVLDRRNLVEDFPLSSCPGIYQRKVDISYEVRVTVFGGKAITCKILSQESSQLVDWRHDLSAGNIRIEPYRLPKKVEDRCIALCEDLGLAFGALDLIVDRSGDYVFIEVNEAGQFLWIEEMLPQFGILDAFCRFLLGDADPISTSKLLLSNYLNSEQSRIDRQALDREYAESPRLASRARIFKER